MTRFLSIPRLPNPALGLLVLALAFGLSSLGPLAAEETPAVTKGHTSDAPAPAAHNEGNHSGGGGGAENPIAPEPSLAIWTVVVFLGLLFVLGRFAWKPLLASLHQREEHLEHVLHETERARNESEQLLAEHRRRLAAAEDQVRALIEEARKDARSAADEIVKKAQAEADAAKQRAERDIATARDQALSEIWQKTADLAVSVAGKVLGKSLNQDDHRRLIDAAVGELPAVPAGANGHGGQRS